jgi:pimeloyl-ACP methyl ester carboxylesterase
MRALSAALVATVLISALPAPAMSATHHLLGSRGPHWTPRLLLREQPPASGDRSHPVLYVHGASFPSALSVMFRFRGSSWADALNEAGFDVFALDFAGYGGSERYPRMNGHRGGEPVGRAAEAEKQVARAVDFIRRETGAPRIAIVAHSWGTMPAALFAERHPDVVSGLVLFGPILRRNGPPHAEGTAWELVTNEQQHRRFTRDVPPGHAPVLEEADFPAWAEAYLDSDPESWSRSPAAVKIPSGPSADVFDAHSGRMPYDPARLNVPLMVVRGTWDSSSTHADVAGFFSELGSQVERCWIEIPEATHLMHLETGRHQLYAVTNEFLAPLTGLATAHALYACDAPAAGGR